ncbi:MAG: FAD-dependent oxidoreductase [Limnochordales bacterium]|nr:FAD-dependent oxidoreductase [Limnochordales bacterium]
MKQRLVVIGGVAAGMTAAARARRLNRDLEIIVLEKGPHISYGACSLPYYLAGHFDDYRLLIARTPEEAREQGIDVRTGHEAVALDLDQRRVTVRAGGREETIGFDVVLLATGAVPVVPRGWELEGLAGVHFLRTIEDAQRLRSQVEAGARRAVIVGGGYIGVEAADALREQGAAVTIIDMLPQLLPNFDADMARHVEDDLRADGVDVRLGDGMAELEAVDGRVVGVRTHAGERIGADLVLVAIGVRPNVALAQAAGVPLGETGAIAVDSRQRTRVEGVYAAGDCCEALHLVTGRPAYIPLGTTANKQGRVAGTVIAGGDAAFPGVVGTAALKARRVTVARTGLSLQQAQAMGYDAAAETIKAKDRVHSYPGAREIWVKLVAERGSGRLLGGQIAGLDGAGVAKRIDVVATALFHGMTVDQFSYLDLSYAPPFSTVWDPLLTAANVLQRRV